MRVSGLTTDSLATIRSVSEASTGFSHRTCDLKSPKNDALLGSHSFNKAMKTWYSRLGNVPTTRTASFCRISDQFSSVSTARFHLSWITNHFYGYIIKFVCVLIFQLPMLTWKRMDVSYSYGETNRWNEMRSLCIFPKYRTRRFPEHLLLGY